MAGVLENAYQSLTNEIAKSMSRSTEQNDVNQLMMMLCAGELYAGMFFSEVEEINLMFNLLICGSGLLVGLFKDDVDWVC